MYRDFRENSISTFTDNGKKRQCKRKTCYQGRNSKVLKEKETAKEWHCMVVYKLCVGFIF